MRRMYTEEQLRKIVREELLKKEKIQPEPAKVKTVKTETKAK